MREARPGEMPDPRPGAPPERIAQPDPGERTSYAPEDPALSALFIVFVRDQKRSAAFYAGALASTPILDVPGMTEFRLSKGARLGLMPETGIRRLLGPGLPDPATAHGIPRSELYLVVDDPSACHQRALAAGAKEVSPLGARSWGDLAAYSLDPDGNLLAFAKTPPGDGGVP